jgi:1,4-dihydroxy-2-naphthoate octaprenyltransferase
MAEANRGSLTSWIVIGLGVIVAAVGWLFVTGLFGAGLIGFGLALIVLGIIDLFRPMVKT